MNGVLTLHILTNLLNEAHLHFCYSQSCSFLYRLVGVLTAASSLPWKLPFQSKGPKNFSSSLLDPAVSPLSPCQSSGPWANFLLMQSSISGFIVLSRFLIIQRHVYHVLPSCLQFLASFLCESLFSLAVFHSPCIIIKMFCLLKSPPYNKKWLRKAISMLIQSLGTVTR